MVIKTKNLGSVNIVEGKIGELICGQKELSQKTPER